MILYEYLKTDIKDALATHFPWFIKNYFDEMLEDQYCIIFYCYILKDLETICSVGYHNVKL
jgi:hypothetical protein